MKRSVVDVICAALIEAAKEIVDLKEQLADSQVEHKARDEVVDRLHAEIIRMKADKERLEYRLNEAKKEIVDLRAAYRQSSLLNDDLQKQLDTAGIRANERNDNVAEMAKRLRDEQTLRKAAIESGAEKNLALGRELADQPLVLETNCSFRHRRVCFEASTNPAKDIFHLKQFEKWWGRQIADYNLGLV